MFELGPMIPATATAAKARTVGEMFRLRAARSATRPGLYRKVDGRWEAITWGAFYLHASSVAAGLQKAGLARGDRVAILGPTQPQWAYLDLGAQLAGMVSFGIYPKQSVEQVRYLLEHADAHIVFVDGREELETVLEAARDLDGVKQIVPWTRDLYEASKGRDARVRPMDEFEGEPLDDAAVCAVQDTIDPDETAIFIYTSGTTGPPKGAMITHRNILSLLASAAEAVPYYSGDISLHFLPMAHAAERVLGFYGRVSTGVAGAYAASTATVLDDLREVRPTLFGSVPRIFEKAHAKILSEIERQSPAVQRLFRWADQVGRERARAIVEERPIPPWLALQHQLADRLVFRKIREAFGGRVRFMLTGAAPTAPEILEFFWAVGIPVYEVYGMTEGTVISHANREHSVRLGTVGRAIEPAECRIAEDGEVLVRAPWVFKGYFKNPDATRETVVDGWLHTGDIGMIDREGYLKITDRKKHLIITAGGKNLAPANIERAIKGEDPLISQVHAHGDRRPYVSALVTPSPLESLEWGLARGLVSKSEVEVRTKELLENPTGRSPALNETMAKLVEQDEYKARVRAAVSRGNQALAQVERVRRFVLLERDFSQEEGELTPTMKLKRKAIEEKFSETFDRIYNEPTFAIEP